MSNITKEELQKQNAEQAATIEALQKQLEEQTKAAQAAKEQADAAQAAAQAAEAAQAPASKPATSDTVKIKLYMDQNIKNPEVVFVNDRKFTIRRGVEVEVPRAVAEVLANKERMMNQIIKYISENADKEDGGK